jgi:hypothetical protein
MNFVLVIGQRQQAIALGGGQDRTTGHVDINLDVVWETVQQWLPELLKQRPAVRLDANDPAAKAYPHEEAMQVVQERIDRTKGKPC